ncbi:MAG: glycosyltransferase [Deltaproteobacteria bacterium]|nr:glycosyltransferase [Candidatus Zymogenaceae bacterium]
MSKKSILYIKLSDSPFITEDENILKDAFEVNSFTLKTAPRPAYAVSLLKMTLWLLCNIRHAHAVYAFFVSWYLIIPALLCRIAGVPLALSIGGFDANWLPALAYGVYHKRISRSLCGFVYRSASLIIPVHASLVRVENRYSEYNTVKEGILNLFDGIRGRIVVIPSGFDTDFWSPGDTEKERVVLTVGNIKTGLNYELKAMADFVEAARRIPEYQFVHIGDYDPHLFDQLVAEPPGNLTLLGFVNHEELLSQLRRSKVYTQLSVSEGLPNSLIQAMLCGCIPVGSAVNGIPDIIGDAGFVVERRDAVAVKTAIRDAMNSALAPRARERAANRYAIAIRRNELVRVFGELTSPPDGTRLHSKKS